MKRIFFFLAIVVAYAAYERFLIPDTTTASVSPTRTLPIADAVQWRPGSQVTGSGTVIRILSDDNEGSRHQRFILELSSGQTLLIAHNIDLAPRVAMLSTGDTVRFYGEYEAGSRGGVIHWTHHDPRGRHVTGWLEHRGRRYQ